MQAPHAPASRRHSNVEPVSDEEKLKLADARGHGAARAGGDRRVGREDVERERGQERDRLRLRGCRGIRPEQELERVRGTVAVGVLQERRGLRVLELEAVGEPVAIRVLVARGRLGALDLEAVLQAVPVGVLLARVGVGPADLVAVLQAVPVGVPPPRARVRALVLVAVGEAVVIPVARLCACRRGQRPGERQGGEAREGDESAHAELAGQAMVRQEFPHFRATWLGIYAAHRLADFKQRHYPVRRSRNPSTLKGLWALPAFLFGRSA